MNGIGKSAHSRERYVGCGMTGLSIKDAACNVKREEGGEWNLSVMEKKDKTWFWVDVRSFTSVFLIHFLRSSVLFLFRAILFSFQIKRLSLHLFSWVRGWVIKWVKGDTIQLVDRGSRGGVAGQKESRGERTTAHAIITSFCFYCRRRIKLPWGSVVKPEVCFSGTCSCSICFSSVKPCRYVPHYFLHVLYLELIPPFIAPLCPPHFKDSSSLFSHRVGIYSTHHAFFLTQFSFPHLSCPQLPVFPLLCDLSWPWISLFKCTQLDTVGKVRGLMVGLAGA